MATIQRRRLILSSVAPALWTFDNLPNKALWLDVDDPSTVNLNGSTISQITGKANGISLTESSASNQPLYVPNAFNGKAIARFSGNQRLTSPTVSDYSSIGYVSVFAVVKQNIVANVGIICGITPVGSPSTRISASTRSSSGNFGIGGRRLDSDGFQVIEGGSTTNYIIYGATINYQSRVISLYQNGNLIASNASFQTAGVTSSTLANILIGNNDALNSGFNGDIGEILTTTQTALNTDDIDRINGRLAHNWQMTNVLPSNHPYKNNPPLL